MPKYWNANEEKDVWNDAFGGGGDGQDDDGTTLPSMLIIGSKESFQHEGNLEWVARRFRFSSPSLRMPSSSSVDEDPSSPCKKKSRTEGNSSAAWLSAIVEEMKALKDDPVLTEYWQPHPHPSQSREEHQDEDLNPPRGYSMQHWSIGVLPTAIGRHNIRARPHAITTLVKKARKKDGKEPIVILLLDDISDAFAAGCAVAKGQSLYSRKTSTMTSEKPNNTTSSSPLHVIFNMVLPDHVLTCLEAVSNGIQLAGRLVDAPANECHTDAMITEAVSVATRYNAKHIVIRGEELREKGLGGLYGVGKAAEHPPALVVLSYYPQQENTNAESSTVPSIVMVGKGIVYDTGGLSIKSSTGMPGMKRDMGGAAAILGAFEALMASSQSTLSRPVHAILCLAENSVASNATRPDDVHTLYSGRTVEINNTDAEGRLVLGDGVAFAVRHLNPCVLIDMATLTGAQGVATGKYFGALYCNQEKLESQAVKSGRTSGDLVHPLPYAPEFFRPEFKSTVADMKNSVKDRSNAQVSCAGQFIGNHLGNFEDGGNWLHIDMASPSYTKSDERATGYGVALLHTLLNDLQSDREEIMDEIVQQA